MSKIKLLIASLCLILLFGCSSQSERENLLLGEVIRVVSGQTVEVRLTGTAEITKIRIIGIDAPDLRQFPWGEAAKKKLSELIIGSSILIESESKQQDSYNRLNAHLWRDKTLISQQLVKTGCVLVNERYPHQYSKLMSESQEYARLMGYGIWNPKQAMRYTPSQFRSMNPQ
jgi:micrococcal nuclease